MFELHAADRAETLVDLLVEVLATPPGDPFAAEWVAVPSIGMRRWLAQQLSRRLGTSGATEAVGHPADGVSANIELPFPAALRRSVLEAGRSTPDDPWQVERLVWPILDILRAGRDDAVLGTLGQLPAGATMAGRARRLADLFDRYTVHRPGLLQGWAAGHDVSPSGEPLAAAQRWQPQVFRLVRDAVGQPSPPERLPELLAAARAGTIDLDLPDRLTFFGLSTLPPDLGPLLQALAVHREVRVLLLAPSPAMTLAAAAAATAASPAGDDHRAVWSFPRRVDPTIDVVVHPLLQSWAQPSRELAAQLGAAGLRPEVVAPALRAVDGDEAPSLLSRLQADIRADRAPARLPRSRSGRPLGCRSTAVAGAHVRWRLCAMPSVASWPTTRR